MAILHWDIEELRPLWEHSLCAHDWRPPHRTGGVKGPGLLLVKDIGCYLMSNGRPGWTRPNRTHLVAYSEELGGCADWQTLAAWCGAEDFTDLLDEETCLRIFSRRGGRLAVRFETDRRHLRVLRRG